MQFDVIDEDNSMVLKETVEGVYTIHKADIHCVSGIIGVVVVVAIVAIVVSVAMRSSCGASRPERTPQNRGRMIIILFMADLRNF